MSVEILNKWLTESAYYLDIFFGIRLLIVPYSENNIIFDQRDVIFSSQFFES